jgi:hypothetical protein
MRIDEIHPGDVIAGKYRVRTILGRNNGLLLEGFHTEFDQRVVIKILLASQGEDRALERFRREARTLAKLESEHVARIIDVGTEPDGSFYLVRQYLEGVDVSAYLRQNGPLAVPDAVLVVLMVAEAVAETHSHKIIVRELQPGHLFVTQRAGGAPLVKITDFGTAKLMRDAAAPGAGGELTATAMFGLSPYSSPELLRKAKNVDVRTDVWSLGAIFYELLTGRPPFTGETAMLMLQITKEDPTPPSQVRSGINPEIDQIISWALAKDVDARFKNVYAFAQTLLPYAPPEGQVLVDRIRQITEAARGRKRDGAAAAPAGPAFANTAPAPAAAAAAPAAGPSPAAQAAQAAQAAHAAQVAQATQRRPEEAQANMRSAQQDNLIVSPPPAMQGAQNYGGPPTGPLPIGGGYPNPGPSGPSHAVGPARPGPGMSPQPMRSGSSSTPTSRKVAMSALAIAAVALPLVVLLVVLRQINQPPPVPSATPVSTESAPTDTGLPGLPTIPSPPSGVTQVAPVPSPPTSGTTTAPTASAGPTAGPTSTGKVRTPPGSGAGSGGGPPPTSGTGGGVPNGTLLAVAVGGNCAFSVNGASKGTAPSIRLSVKPGTYTVACKPDTGNAMSKSVNVKSEETSMMAFPLRQ